MTLISHDHRFIFLKTRKTAGTSAEMYLQPFCTPPGTPVTEWGEAIVSDHGIVGQRLGRDLLQTPPPPGAVRDVWFSHQTVKSLRQQVPRRVWKTYEKITVVRNPFAKVLSGFFWRNRNATLPQDAKALITRFRNHVVKRTFTTDVDITHEQRLFGKPRLVAQTILRAEHLATDLAALAARLGLDTARTNLPVTKNSGSAPRAIPLGDWYDTPTTDIVRRRLAWMFDAGGYEEVPR